MGAQGRDGSTLQQRGVVFLYSAAVFFHGVQTGHHRPLALEGLVLKLCRAVSGVHVPSVAWVRRQPGDMAIEYILMLFRQIGRLGSWIVGLRYALFASTPLIGCLEQDQLRLGVDAGKVF